MRDPAPPARANRWRRLDVWDDRPLRLDRFAREDAANGFCVAAGPFDPAPSLTLTDGRVTEMDGRAEAEFDILDQFIATHHIDLAVADEALAIPTAEFARWLVDVSVPRAQIVRLARGMTPAKLAAVVGELSMVELAFAQAKLRVRETPGNQAHVTNAKDDPLQLAADAATAALLGFNEIETTMRVARNAWLNAMACMVGAAVGKGDVLFQCSIEEAEELRLGLAGLTSYAETVSVYGTEASFLDGDDTPWSKGFLLSAYASRGMKARCTSGGGSELLMGFHGARSILYLEARCLCLQRGMGSQGTQNGGIDGAPITTSLPRGGWEIFAENVLAALLDLECASGNDTRTSSSEIRVGAKIMPYLMAGTDFICSGMGSVMAYDNSFAASLFNGEEIEDFLALQHDYGLDGGLTPPDPDLTLDLRRRAVEAVAAVLEELGLAQVEPHMIDSVVAAAGSAETATLAPGTITAASEAIRARGLGLADVIAALARRGFRPEAETLMRILRLRVSGDHLQTAAILKDGRVVSALNAPNDYRGPGTGHRVTAARLAELAGMRGRIGRAEVLAAEGGRSLAADEARRYRLVEVGPAQTGTAATEVVIGLSPAFGLHLHQTTAGHPLSQVLRSLAEGVVAGGGLPRFVRLRHTADTSFLGLTAARLSGSGIGIGIQAKGTAVIHQRDRLPHMNLELFSTAPITTLAHYRAMGANAARFAAGEHPDPVIVPYDGQAIHARHHVRTALLYGVETALVDPAAAPADLIVEFLA